jgi:hypothetical protein
MVGKHTWEICGKKDVTQIQVEEKSMSLNVLFHVFQMET